MNYSRPIVPTHLSRYLLLALAAGTALADGPVPAGATNAVAVLASGDLLLAGHTLARLDGATLAVRWTRPLDEPATCAAPLAAGRFLTATRRQVRVHTAEGEIEDEWAPLAEQAWITSLAVGAGQVFVCDAGQRAVWRYTLDGRMLGRIPATADAPPEERFTVPSPYFDVAFADDAFWVVNPGRLEVRRYTPDGRRTGTWGAASMHDPAGFVGCCNPIHLAALPGGGFATAEKGVPRIKRYAADGTLRDIVAGPDAFARFRVVADIAVDAHGRILVLDGGRLRRFGSGSP